MLRKLSYLAILILGLAPHPAFSQELPPPPDDFETGDPQPPAFDEPVIEDTYSPAPAPMIPNIEQMTAAPSDPSDPSATPEWEDIESDAEPELEPVEESNGRETHLIKFEFISRIQFINTDPATNSRDPYMEVQYINRFQAAVDLTRGRTLTNVEAEYDVDHWGALAKGSLFECKLRIDLPENPVEVSTQIPKVDVQPGEIAPLQPLTVKINYKKDFIENWFSLCTDTAGSQLNTQGDTEEYNSRVLEMIEPSIRSLVFEEFDPMRGAKLPLSVQPKSFNDSDLVNEIVVSGEGGIEVEPIDRP